MTLELNGSKRKELRATLVDAFPDWRALKKMLDAQLDLKLDLITSQALGLDDVTFELIQWAQARGRLGDLIIAARNENPGNERLERFAASLALSSAVALPTGSLEKVVGSNNTFLDVARWRAELTRAEWRVCRIDDKGTGAGTGFLIGPDLVITNYHVIDRLLEKPAEVQSWSCRFDYKLSETGDEVSPGRIVKLASDFRVDESPYSKVDLELDPKSDEPTDEELDFALFRLAEPVGEQPMGKTAQSDVRHWIKLSTAAVDYASRRVIAILQHPLAHPMKLALGMDQEIKVNGAGNRIRYTVPTESGSSGSPVFDGDWNLIALHHSGDPRTVKPEFNEGIPIAKIASREKVAAALPK